MTQNNPKSSQIGLSCPKLLQLIWIRSKIRSKIFSKKISVRFVFIAIKMPKKHKKLKKMAIIAKNLVYMFILGYVPESI